MAEKIGVVLLNLGGPDSLDAVEPFLYNLFSDPDIIDFPLAFLFRKRLAKLISSKRHPRIQEQYKEIGGKSPLKDYTLKQAALLEKRLNEQEGVDAKVYVAMRYWRPFTEDALDAIQADGVRKIILLPLYPQFSKATTTSSLKEWDKVVAERGLASELDATLIDSYQADPHYIDALVQRVDETFEKFPADAREDVHLVFSAHGTPMKLVREGDPYSHHIAETVDAMMKRGGWRNEHSLCYQSKVGPLKWLTPATPDTIEELAKKGVTNMLVIPVAFTSDHLETLFELDIEYRKFAKEVGVKHYHVMEGLNDSPLFIETLAKLVVAKFGASQPQAKAATVTTE